MGRKNPPKHNRQWKHLPQTTKAAEEAQSSLGSAAIVPSEELIIPRAQLLPYNATGCSEDPRSGGSTTDRAGARRGGSGSSRWLREKASRAPPALGNPTVGNGCAELSLARAGGPAHGRHARALPHRRPQPQRGAPPGCGDAARGFLAGFCWSQGKGPCSFSLLAGEGLLASFICLGNKAR